MGSALYFPALTLNSWAGGQWLDINELYLAPVVAMSAFFFFLSAAVLKSPSWQYALLSTLLLCSMMFAIPNVTYPIGSSYYETLEIGLSRLSGVGYAFTTCVYCLVVLSRKDGNR